MQSHWSIAADCWGSAPRSFSGALLSSHGCGVTSLPFVSSSRPLRLAWLSSACLMHTLHPSIHTHHPNEHCANKAQLPFEFPTFLLPHYLVT